MTMTAEREAIVRIAKGLTEAQREAIPELIGTWGLPLGHNAWPLVNVGTVDGDDANRLLHLGVLDAVEVENQPLPEPLIGDGCDIPDVQSRWVLQLTPLGLAVRDHLKESTHE